MSQAIPAVAADETFNGTWLFRSRYTDAPGFRTHNVEEGSGPETLLLLHGEPTWSYLFRQQIPDWAARHRVIAVDHMGFGKSAAPPDRTYWLQDYIDNFERFVLALELHNVNLDMHDFEGPTGYCMPSISFHCLAKRSRTAKCITCQELATTTRKTRPNRLLGSWLNPCRRATSPTERPLAKPP